MLRLMSVCGGAGPYSAMSEWAKVVPRNATVKEIKRVITTTLLKVSPGPLHAHIAHMHTLRTHTSHRRLTYILTNRSGVGTPDL